MRGIDSGTVAEGVGRGLVVGRRLGIIEGVGLRSISSTPTLPGTGGAFLMGGSGRSSSSSNRKQVSSAFALLIEGRIKLSDWSKAEARRGRHGAVGANTRSSSGASGYLWR
jgi:hypothetical protein